jgi:hypothetical protein
MHSHFHLKVYSSVCPQHFKPKFIQGYTNFAENIILGDTILEDFVSYRRPWVGLNGAYEKSPLLQTTVIEKDGEALKLAPQHQSPYF